VRVVEEEREITPLSSLFGELDAGRSIDAAGRITLSRMRRFHFRKERDRLEFAVAQQLKV